MEHVLEVESEMAFSFSPLYSLALQEMSGFAVTCCNSLCLDACTHTTPTKPHAVTSRAFSQVAESKMCEARISETVH